jgi:acid stress chaperone HdeB
MLGEKMLTIIKFVPALAVAVGLIVALEIVPAARAQVTLDVSKITCEQYTGYKVTNPQNIAIWVSGYYHGKRGNTTLDTQGLVANAKKLRDYCRRNPQTLVMQAVETLSGTDR